jgi:WhiB family redox-sensing transcriptional regulator
MLSSDSRRSTAWMSRGACQGEDPELFFPIASTSPFRDQINAGKAICVRCSELEMCLFLRGQDCARWHLGAESRRTNGA